MVSKVAAVAEPWQHLTAGRQCIALATDLCCSPSAAIQLAGNHTAVAASSLTRIAAEQWSRSCMLCQAATPTELRRVSMTLWL
eukprot:3868879-Alexandrium_andersonii.AAC.1